MQPGHGEEGSHEAIQAPRERPARLDCLAEPVIGPATSGRTRWLAVTKRIHFTAVTSTLSDAVRPKRSGQYMSSTLACGRTYLPGATARTT
jgi:hypothetical protein